MMWCRIAVVCVAIQAGRCIDDLAHMLGTAPPYWPRNLGPAWPSSAPTAIAERLLGMCRREPVADHPFAYWVMAPWGAEGRDEQAPLQAVGIESGRLYRCHVGWLVNDDLDIGYPVKDFLDQAWLLGLRVVIGLDEALYRQPSRTCSPERPCEAEGICYLQRYGCYDNVRKAWRRMLQSGVVQDGLYHPALHFVVLAWEPDLVVKSYCRAEGLECSWPQLLRGVLSSWDALLDAEAELGVQGSVNFSVTFNATERAPSHLLPKCYFMKYPEGCGDYHGLRNIWLAANNLLNDSYEPHNDLGESFKNRWAHSISAVMDSESAKQYVQEFYSFITPMHQAPARVLAVRPT